MSKDDEKPPKKGEKKNRFRVVKTGESVLAKPSVETVKQLFMASPHLEWIPFADSMNWDAGTTRDLYPVSDWISQKKDQLARRQSEQIAELLFDHRSRWHRDVLKTLRDYPEAADAMLGIIKHRENELIGMINHDMEEKSLAQVEGRQANLRFSKVKTSELLSLSAALKVAVETKHKSLLISDWSVRVAEQFTDPKQFEREENKMKDTGWKLEVIGGENLTVPQMQQLLGQYYDSPSHIHTPQEVAPPPEMAPLEPEED